MFKELKEAYAESPKWIRRLVVFGIAGWSIYLIRTMTLVIVDYVL
jgi:hypothetical protein